LAEFLFTTYKTIHFSEFCKLFGKLAFAYPFFIYCIIGDKTAIPNGFLGLTKLKIALFGFTRF